MHYRGVCSCRHHQIIVLNACNEVSDVSVLDYDCGEIGLVSVFLSDVLFGPRDCRRCERLEKENTAVAFYEKVRLDFSRVSRRVTGKYERIVMRRHHASKWRRCPRK